MPDLFVDLPDAAQLIAGTISDSGEFALEVCSGEGVFTIGLLMAKVPCLRPWDSQFGEQFNVLSNGCMCYLHWQRIGIWP